jgi:outer membrane protein assembly factor BamB
MTFVLVLDLFLLRGVRLDTATGPRAVPGSQQQRRFAGRAKAVFGGAFQSHLLRAGDGSRSGNADTLLAVSRRTLPATLMAFLLLATPAPLRAADWPQFRGPAANCVSLESNLPSNLIAKSNIAWQVDLPAEGLSSPIIIGDRVFVTCAGGNRQQTLHVICYNAADGSKRWERRFWATGRTMCNKKTSVAAPTPASDGKIVAAIFSSNDAICLDLDGNLLWFRGLGRDYPNASNNLGMSSSLVIVDGVVVAQVESESEAFVAGLDAKTGVNRWKLDRARKANWSSPVVLPGAHPSVALQSSDGLTVIEPATGKTLWQYLEGTSSIPSSTPFGDVLFVPSRGITALQLGARNEAPKQLWRSGQLHPGTASPVVLAGKIFALSDNGVLSCGGAGTGSRLWQLRLKGEFSATPLAAGHLLYCVNEKGLIQVIDISKAEGEVISELDLAEQFLSTPSVSNGSIYFRSRTRLWKFSSIPTVGDHVRSL